MNALKTIARKFDVRIAHPKEMVRQRIANDADRLNRAGRDAARLVVVNEALSRCTELLYVLDSGRLCNVDRVTFRLLIPAPWGGKGWRVWGLRYWEGRALRRILWERQATFKSGQVRPPLFTYDPDAWAWHLNYGDYGTLNAAGWYLKRAAVTLQEWGGMTTGIADGLS
jgi:hypothetical protein